MLESKIYFCIYFYFISVKSDDSVLASGAGDSTLILWKDVTKKEREEQAQENEKRILEEQQLANLMQQGLLLEALGMAIRLDQPYRSLNILKGLFLFSIVCLKIFHLNFSSFFLKI